MGVRFSPGGRAMMPCINLAGPGPPNTERSKPSPQRCCGRNHCLGVLDNDSSHPLVGECDGRLGHFKSWSICWQCVHD
eukprot:4869512-Lingulodinium_polyedra.AAC.1